MEFKVTPYVVPQSIAWNYEELKTALTEKAETYAAIAYTDDQLKIAKADRANLNRLKKALNDERIRQEREYMQPFATFKAQVNEIISIIDKPIEAIDRQVKAFEEKQKVEKRERIEAYWHGMLQGDRVPSAVCFSHIFEEKWLNASVSMPSIMQAIDEKLVKLAADLAIVRDLPAYAFEAEQTYLSTLDLAKAISEAHRLEEMAQRKAATVRESQTVEPLENPEQLPAAEQEREWISFRALLTPDDAKALKIFCQTRGIKIEAL